MPPPLAASGRRRERAHAARQGRRRRRRRDRRTTSGASRRIPSSSWRIEADPRRRAPTPASTRATSTASRPTATTATSRRASRPRSAAAQLRFSNMQWGGGGGGGSGAVANAAAAIATGQADCVVVFRALAQGQFGRFGAGPAREDASSGRGRPHVAVRPDVAGADVRHEGQPLHARPRRRSRRRCAPSRWPPTSTRRTTRAR